MENNTVMKKEEFEKEFYDILKRAMFCAEKARYENLLSLEDIIDHEKEGNRDIFEYGLRFVVDGTDAEWLDKMLSNIVNQEKDELKFILKTIQKEAVLFLQCGYSPYHLAAHLNSYTDIPPNAPEYKKIVDESDDRGMAYWKQRKERHANLNLWDELLSGLQGPKLIVISSRPHKGKSILSLAIAKKMVCVKEKTISFFALRDSEEYTRRRLGMIDVGGSDFIKHSPRFIIFDKEPMSFADLAENIRSLYIKKDIKAVFIDDLGSLYSVNYIPVGKKENAALLIGLKTLAMELNIPVIVTLRLPQQKSDRYPSPQTVQSLISPGDAHNCIDEYFLIEKDDYREKTFRAYKRSENGDWIGKEMQWKAPSWE